MTSYEVRFAPGAERTFRQLEPSVRTRIGNALQRLAGEVASTGRVHGKRVKTIKGRADSFHRLRVGDYRIMYDVLEDDYVLLVLGIVHRRDLERWLRNR